MDWQALFINNMNWQFAIEIVIRTLIMFAIILIFLRISGKQSIQHLGQVRTAILEPNGNVSFLFYEDNDVKPGLPVMPKLYKQKQKNISKKGDYACSFCGNIEHINEGPKKCERCEKEEWVEAIDTCRLS